MSEHISKWFPKDYTPRLKKNDHCIVASWMSRNVHPKEHEIFMERFLKEFPHNPKTESEMLLRELKRRHCKMKLL